MSEAASDAVLNSSVGVGGWLVRGWAGAVDSVYLRRWQACRMQKLRVKMERKAASWRRARRGAACTHDAAALTQRVEMAGGGLTPRSFRRCWIGATP